MKKNFNERLKEELEKLGEQKKIAEQIGVTPNTLVNATRGYNSPKVSLLLDIQDLYPDFDSGYIMTGRRSTLDLEYNLEKAQKMIEDLKAELDFHRAIVSKLVGKHKVVSQRPLAQSPKEPIRRSSLENARR